MILHPGKSILRGGVHTNLRQLHRSKKKTSKIQYLIENKCLFTQNRRIIIFLDRKSTKTINNRNIIGLNRMGQLKH